MHQDKRKKPEDLSTRTKRFALQTIRLHSALPKNAAAQVVGKQMLSSGTSVGVYYRESIRSRSDAELVSKQEGALQGLEETRYWFEPLDGSGSVKPEWLAGLMEEADQLAAILVTRVKKIKARP